VSAPSSSGQRPALAIGTAETVIASHGKGFSLNLGTAWKTSGLAQTAAFLILRPCEEPSSYRVLPKLENRNSKLAAIFEFRFSNFALSLSAPFCMLTEMSCQLPQVTSGNRWPARTEFAPACGTFAQMTREERRTCGQVRATSPRQHPKSES
jgi:hypothetical protein